MLSVFDPATVTEIARLTREHRLRTASLRRAARTREKPAPRAIVSTLTAWPTRLVAQLFSHRKPARGHPRINRDIPPNSRPSTGW